MIAVKTRAEVLDNARAIFETAPFLVDLVIALGDKDRDCTVKFVTGRSTGGSVEWPPDGGFEK